MKLFCTFVAAVVVAVGVPTVSEASIASAAAKAAARRVIPMRAAPQAAKAASEVARPPVAAVKPRDVLVSRSRYPESAANIDHAQRMGQPTVLTLDRVGAAERRRESLQHIKRQPYRSLAGKDRDEYPPALTGEGGFNSNVRYIGAGDNRGSGKAIERQVRDLPDGARIRVLVTH